MVVSGKHRILSLSVLSIALITYLRVRLNRTSKKREELAKGTDSRASVGQSYEVFLSFHGRDTRHGFTGFLYRDMVKAGILVFRDNESLHVGQRIGDELLQAIRNSKIYIPIFSKNYASSHWCLRELAHMVECASELNADKEILPIFLDVEPDDVKLKTNLYSKDLSNHQKKYCTEVESWKEALVKVDKVKGWNLKTDESQVDLIKSVIETVLRKLNVRNKKIVTKDLVGVDDRAEAMIKMLEVGDDSVQFLGIHGMGGIGKTTLAKVIFNRLSSHFKYCHFLSDVRETSQRLGMVALQIQLLSKFLDSQSTLNQIHDTDDGAILIERVFRDKKVLIVLDDVDAKKQLESLAKKVDWFGCGSRIIITTRYQSVLTIQVEATSEAPANILAYEVSEMECDHALELFSKHAFRRDSPPNHYIPISKQIVRTLGNLPLALETIGSFLNGKSIEIWGDTSNKLKGNPPNEVQQTLMITYGKLDDAQRQVFLDIACFFANEEKTYSSYMWDACEYYPHHTLEVLFLMSLIKIKDDNTFWMHDQVRDLGRKIVKEENSNDPCERSRVHNPEEALSILKRKKGSGKIQALSLALVGDGRRGLTEFEVRLPGVHKAIILKHDEFADLEKLRFFRGDGVSFVGDFNNLLSNLRWFSCQNYPFTFNAENFHPTNLVVLDLSWSQISEKSFGWIKEARKLKVLDLNYCTDLRRTPDLSTLVSLEILNLRSCLKLESIDWIKEARKLKVLNLSTCYELSRIPDLSTLVHLEILILCSCSKIKELPDSIGRLQSLIELDLHGTGIDHLPDSFGNLKQLKTLRMRDIEEGLTKLPNAVWLVQTVVEPLWLPNALYLSCMKMPDLPWTQISGLPTVASLVSNILRVELAGQGSAGCPYETLDPLRDLETVFSFPVKLGQTHSQVEKQVLASQRMRFLVQLPSSSREEVFRELMTTHLQHLCYSPASCCWMPIFLGVRDSELEKFLMQNDTISKWLARIVPEVEESTYPESP